MSYPGEVLWSEVRSPYHGLSFNECHCAHWIKEGVDWAPAQLGHSLISVCFVNSGLAKAFLASGEASSVLLKCQTVHSLLNSINLDSITFTEKKTLQIQWHWWKYLIRNTLHTDVDIEMSTVKKGLELVSFVMSNHWKHLIVLCQSHSSTKSFSLHSILQLHSRTMSRLFYNVCTLNFVTLICSWWANQSWGLGLVLQSGGR